MLKAPEKLDSYKEKPQPKKVVAACLNPRPPKSIGRVACCQEASGRAVLVITFRERHVPVSSVSSGDQLCPEELF